VTGSSDRGSLPGSARATVPGGGRSSDPRECASFTRRRPRLVVDGPWLYARPRWYAAAAGSRGIAAANTRRTRNICSRCWSPAGVWPSGSLGGAGQPGFARHRFERLPAEPKVLLAAASQWCGLARPARRRLSHQLLAQLPCPLLTLRVQLARGKALGPEAALEVVAGEGTGYRRGHQRGDPLACLLR
jgi:hypothetical protein